LRSVMLVVQVMTRKNKHLESDVNFAYFSRWILGRHQQGCFVTNILSRFVSNLRYHAGTVT